MSFKSVSDLELVPQTKRAIEDETKATTNVVRHFIEIERRGLHLARGFSSMFLMATQEFKYGKAAAQRRVNAMALAIEVPAVLELIDSRQICLQSAADIQTFLNRERGARRAYTASEKCALVELCAGLSTREVQDELVKRNPSIDFNESKKLIAPDRFRVSHTLSAELEDKLARIKSLLSHVNPYMNREELLEYMAELTLEKIDPVRKAQRSAKAREKAKASKKPEPVAAQSDVIFDVISLDAAASSFKPRATTYGAEPELVPAQEPSLTFGEEVVSEYGEIQLVAKLDGDEPKKTCEQRKSRYIKAADARKALERNAESGCEYVDSRSGRRCGSNHQLQRDHVVAYSAGGLNTHENLQMLCAQHNRWKFHQSRVVREAFVHYESAV